MNDEYFEGLNIVGIFKFNIPSGEGSVELSVLSEANSINIDLESSNSKN